MKKQPESKDRIVIKIIFFIYLLIVIKLIIFKFPLEHILEITRNWEKSVVLEGIQRANFTLFKTIRMYIDYAYKLNSFENLIGNIAIFIPFGLLIPYVRAKCKNFFVMLLNALVFIFGIEIFQLFSGLGSFDVDDILLNALGAVIGYLLYLGANAFHKKRRKHN